MYIYLFILFFLKVLCLPFSEVVMEHHAKIAHIYHSNRDIVLFILLCFLPCQSSVHLFIKIILSRLFELPNTFPLNNLSQIHLHS